MNAQMRVFVSNVVSCQGLTPSQQRELRQQYTFTPKRPPGAPMHVRPSPVVLCKTLSSCFVVPRDMQLLRSIPPDDVVDCQDALHAPAPTSQAGDRPTFNKTLDASRNQPKAVDQCITMLTSHPLGGGCLLSLPPGFGKTACALYIASVVSRRRTLILVHTSVLASQWRDRVLTFLDSAVPVVVSSQKPPPDLDESTHVIVLLQTIVAHAKSQKLGWIDRLHHDMVIVDECHHICARTLCRVVEEVGCRYRLGLSATIERKDGLDSMLTCLIGPIAFRCERHDEPNLTVEVVKYYPKQALSGHHWPPKLTFVESLNAIAADPSRLNLVLDIVVDLYHKGRHIIVLSDRLALLQSIRDHLATINIDHHMAIGGSRECSLDRPVMLATYQFASEGLDIPSLNTCILATPRIDVKQSVGRILRCPGGNPIVVDIVDQHMPILKRQFSKRRTFYTSSLEDGGLNATIADRTDRCDKKQT